jgi:hypothetical protein
MRRLVLLAVLTVAGCDGSPGSLGITGPGAAPTPARAPDDSTIGNPGVPSYGNSYGPSIGPNQSGGRYFNYN